MIGQKELLITLHHNTDPWLVRKNHLQHCIIKLTRDWSSSYVRTIYSPVS